MSFVTAFEKMALIPVGGRMDDMYDSTATKYYQMVHSPTLHGAVSGLKYGLPTAAVAAMVSPRGLKGRNAAILGGLVGGLAGLSSLGQKRYENVLESAHIKYHLEE